MSNQRFESTPIFKVGSDPVVIQQVPGSSAPLLEIKDHTGAALMSVTSSGQMTSPSLTGTPTAPTATPGTNTTQIATTAFVRTEVSNLIASAPAALDTLDELAAALGDDANFATTVTNSLAAKAPLASPAFTGTPTAPTAAAGTNTTQIATTAFAQELVNAFLPAGMISPFAGSSAPSGWLLCAGQVVSRTTYARLFSALGTTYNTGGEAGTDFRLPDLRGRVIAGVDNMGGVAASRLSAATITGGGDALGEVGGAETHVLTQAQLASHTHIQDSHGHGITDPGHTHLFLPKWQGSAGTGVNLDINGYGNDYGLSGYINGSTTGVTVNNNTATNQSTGSNQAHNNVQPTIVLNYIIKV